MMSCCFFMLISVIAPIPITMHLGLAHKENITASIKQSEKQLIYSISKSYNGNTYPFNVVAYWHATPSQHVTKVIVVGDTSLCKLYSQTCNTWWCRGRNTMCGGPGAIFDMSIFTFFFFTYRIRLNHKF